MENNKLPFLILLPEGQVKRYNFVIEISKNLLPQTVSRFRPPYYRKIVLIPNSNNLRYELEHILLFFKSFEGWIWEKEKGKSVSSEKSLYIFEDINHEFVLFSSQNKYEDLEQSKESLKLFLKKVKIPYEEEELTLNNVIRFWQIFSKSFDIAFMWSSLPSYGTALSANRKIPFWSDSKPFR